jgi:anaerobic ribonucleoside-triphosphate reductase
MDIDEIIAKKQVELAELRLELRKYDILVSEKNHEIDELIIEKDLTTPKRTISDQIKEQHAKEVERAEKRAHVASSLQSLVEKAVDGGSPADTTIKTLSVESASILELGQGVVDLLGEGVQQEARKKAKRG